MPSFAFCTPFKVIAARFHVSVERFDERAVTITGNHLGRVVTVRDKRQRFETILAPRDAQMTPKPIFGCERDRLKQVRLSSLAMGQKFLNRGRGNIGTRDTIMFLDANGKADIEVCQPPRQLGGTEFTISDHLHRHLREDGMEGKDGEDRCQEGFLVSKGRTPPFRKKTPKNGKRPTMIRDGTQKEVEMNP